MRSIEENIEALSRAMLSEAKEEAEKILTDSRSKADGIRKNAEEQAQAIRAEILDRARQEADRLRGQNIATTQMKARTATLEHREKLLKKVFADALAQIPSVQKWSDYDSIALRLVREAVAQLNSDQIIIHADKTTSQYLTDQVLAEISKEKNIHLKLGKTLEDVTGVIAETADGHLQYDNTLETRMNRLTNSLRSPVYRILIGETI